MSTITLTAAKTDAERQIVRNLFVGFFADLSQYDENLVVNEYGLPTWKPSGLPGPTTLAECATINWWIRDKCDLYVIRADGTPAGFAIVLADRNHLVPDVEFELMDFYIAPKYRRQGVGSAAARQIFDTRRGAWQLFILEKNEPARRFWRKLVGEYTSGDFQELNGGTEIRFGDAAGAFGVINP